MQRFSPDFQKHVLTLLSPEAGADKKIVALHVSFIWSETPDGWEFWNDEYERLNAGQPLSARAKTALVDLAEEVRPA